MKVTTSLMEALKADEELHLSLATKMQDLLKTQDPTKSTLLIAGDPFAARSTGLTTPKEGESSALELRAARTMEFLENNFELVFDPETRQLLPDDEPATSTDAKNILADPARVILLTGLMAAEDALYRKLELKKERMEMHRRMGLDEDRYLPDPVETNPWSNSPPAPGCGYNNKKKVRKEHKRTVRKIAKRSRQINRSKK